MDRKIQKKRLDSSFLANKASVFVGALGARNVLNLSFSLRVMKLGIKTMK